MVTSPSDVYQKDITLSDYIEFILYSIHCTKLDSI